MRRPGTTILIVFACSLVGSIAMAEALPELNDPLDRKGGAALRSACEQRLFDCVYSAGEKRQERHEQVEIYRQAVAENGRNRLPNSVARLHLAVINHLDQISYPTPRESIEDSRASLLCTWKATPNKCQHEWKKIQEQARRRTAEAREVLRETATY